jgi:ATP-dependent Lhr-like helicase
LVPRLPNDPLSTFSEPTRAWFEASYAEPTPAQALAWPAIAGGEHVLLSAPTGSGKTLAAFLWALDRLSAGGGSRQSGVRVLYVSPLKALSYDIERNLRAPLRGIGADVSVGIRTGDTSQGERAAMARKPPAILITTPESLYLILCSRARQMLRTVETVIVDEIHAVAASKRGAHLALTLERLQREVRIAGDGNEVQRVGLSATQRPLEEIGHFLVGPRREVRILDAGARGASKQLDLRIHVPVESMTDLQDVPADPLQPAPGGESLRGSIWPAIYPELLRLVREHRSTIVFVNNRRSAERVALRLNELADAEIARAHHGSLSREERTLVEEQLKAGRLPCLVATSSLELGIDMGAVDLVVQIESPKSVARGLQRIGRAGHGVGDVSKGRIFPKFRGDLLECAVVCRRMREGEIEPTVVPRNALDVLAQQIVAIAAAADDGGVESGLAGREGGRGGDDQADGPGGIANPNSAAADTSALGVVADPSGIAVDDLYELVSSSYSFSELPRSLLENVLDMLDGRYPSSEFGDLRARIVWDRVGGRIRARRGARQLAVANAGTIPDRGLYSVTLPDGRRVGELDEEMVYEARPGQVFLLGASSWRIEEIGRDRVIVTPAPGVPGAVPFWKGDGVGRPKELGRAIGEFARWAVEQDAERLARDYDLDTLSARNLVEYLREQQDATQVLPSDRTIVLERFRDEIGDWRLCLLSPYGGRVHAAWGLAISARFKETFGIDGEALWSDDGIVLRLPDFDLDGAGDPDERDFERTAGSTGDAGARSYADLVALDPDEVQEAIVSELGSSALFGARFRENASRALLIPRAYPGRRTPLWQQRLKAQGLLEVARRYPDFPIVLETYRECLRDVLDLDGLRELLRGLATREVSLVEVQTQSASPFAGSLLFDYVATYMYEGDTPAAERRAAALSLDRDLLRELLGQEELRELIDPGALARVQDDLQCRSALTRATSADSLHDVLRRVGDLSLGELAERVLPELDAEAMLAALERERRAVRVRVGGEQRAIAADDAGLYRDALGIPPPPGLPSAFLADVPDALTRLVERYARTHGPFTGAELHERYGVDASAALREAERAGTLVRGELRPDPHSSSVPAGTSSPAEEGGGREWCEVGVLRMLRRASLAALRKEIESVDARALAAFMPSWQGVDRYRHGPLEASEQGSPRPPSTSGPARAPFDSAAPESFRPGGLDGGPARAPFDSAAPESFRHGGLDGGPTRPPLRPGSARAPFGRGAARGVSLAAGVERLREVLVPLQGLALPAATWERDVLPARTGSYSPSWMDALCASGELAWVGADRAKVGQPGRSSGRVALYFREDAPVLGPPPQAAAEPPSRSEHDLLRARLGTGVGGSCFFADLLVDLDLPAAALSEALWDLVWAGEVTNDAFAPLRAPRLALASSAAGARAGARGGGRRRFGHSAVRAGRSPGGAVQGRWSLTEALFAGAADPRERRRALAELLLERYGVLTREQVLAEGVQGGFSALYTPLSELETLGVCRRGYFVEGLGGAQFALPGAVERLRATRRESEPRTRVLAAVDPAQPYGAALPWPRRDRNGRRPARVAGAYVVLVDAEPVLYLERGGRGILTLADEERPSRGEPGRVEPGRSEPGWSGPGRSGPGGGEPGRVELALRALADAVRGGRVGAVALERVDGGAAIGSALEPVLVELGFSQGPRRLTLRA